MALLKYIAYILILIIEYAVKISVFIFSLPDFCVYLIIAIFYMICNLKNIINDMFSGNAIDISIKIFEKIKAPFIVSFIINSVTWYLIIYFYNA